jgi:tetratricopeptide (TPR) repeat protein
VTARLDPDLLATEVDAARHDYWLGHAARSAQRYRAVVRRLQRPGHRSAALEGVKVRALIGLAMTEFEIYGQVDPALSRLAEADLVIRDVELTALRASVHGQRALLLLRSGDVGGSLAEFDRAVEHVDDAGPDDQIPILLNRGALELERGSLAKAVDSLERCVDVASAAKHPVGETKARYNLAYAEFLRGRIPHALSLMEEADVITPGAAHPVRLLDRARVLREAGLTTDADDLLGRASQIMAGSRLFQDLAETELVRAECALVEGEPKRARAFAASAYRRFHRRGNLRWQRRAELMVLRCDRQAADEKAPGPRRTALRGIATRAADLAAACRTEGRYDLARSAALLAAECRLRAGEPGGRVPRLRRTDSLETRLQTREVRALAALADGDHTRSTAEVRRGLAELGSYQNRFGSLDLRTASAVHGVALNRLQLHVAMQTGRPSVVFAGIERARAVSTRLAQVHPPSDERTADLLTELRQVEEEARGLAGDPAVAETLVRLRARASTLQRDIRARAWELEGDHADPMHESATLGPVRAAAGDRAFATYARHQGRWVAVVAAGRRVELHEDLASVAEVDELVRRIRADLDAIAMPHLPEPIETAVRRSTEDCLGRLDEMLVRPLRLGDRSLVVSCSGSLVVLPWSMLPSRSGLPVVVTPSATSWLRAQEQLVRRNRPRVVAISGPDLHRSADEAERAGTAWASARVVTGQQATVAVVQRALERADVVHIAAHGTHRQDSPLFSCLRLADGQLYAYELDATSHIAPFVALSACEAGLATVRPGDEGLGMTNALMQLGTRSVLAGVARVRDDVAADVMDKVHHEMASGVDSASALAAAQAASTAAGAPVPFVCFGSAW